MEAAVSDDKNPFAELDDEQVIAKLEEGAFAEEFAHSDNWLIFRQGCEILSHKAQYLLERTDPIKDPTGVIEAQVNCKFTKNVLKSIIDGIRNEGRLAFDEAKKRGLRKKLDLDQPQK